MQDEEKFDRQDLISELTKFGYSIGEAQFIVNGNTYYLSKTSLEKAKENIRNRRKK